MAAFNIFLALCFLPLTSSYDVHYGHSFNTRKQTHYPLRERFPWHVFVSSVKCSGVLIQEQWILSSALCTKLVKAKLNSKHNVDSDHSTVFIRVGNHHVDLQARGEDTAPVLRALVYPKYNASASTGNFGLLYLARKVMLPDDLPVSHAKLPDFETNNVSRRLLGKITGWGHLSGRSSQFKTLVQSDVLLTPGRDCHRSFRDRSKGKLLDKSWCAVAGTKGMCSTDQGSPVVIKQDGHWAVVGVYTYGPTCSSTTRDVALFSRIDHEVRQWIEKLFTVGDKPQCHPSGHKILDIPARAQSNQVDSVLPLCDNKLEEAWYKLELDGIPAEIPTSCPEIGSCGTHAQIWLQPAGHPEFGEEKNGSACVAWEGVDRFCCLWRLPVHVIHCGGFLVYHLKRTDDCSAYCAKEADKVPCGPGKIGYAPKCRVREQYPILDGPPQITPVVPPDNILAGESIHLLCTYDILAPGPYRVGYKVTWYKLISFLGGKPGKLVLLSNRTEETAVVISTKSAEFYLGDRIICEVMAFFLESPERTSPTFSSDDFFVGIKVEPSSLVTSEDHKIREFVLRLTVPLICQPDHPNCTIRISMHLVPVVDHLQTLLTSDIALSTCEVILKPQPCSRRDCGRKIVRFVAVSDYVNDGDRRTRIITEPARSQSLLWKSYDPADVFVLSKDVKTPRCYLFTESHMRTLTGRYYRISAGATTFLLYKSSTRPFEVHTRFWACSRSRNQGFCACGVAARDGDDVIEIDMCHGRFKETSVQISIRSRLPLAKGVRITEAITGKRYTAYFPSGVYVRVDVFNWGLNLQIQSSGRDLNQVTGLCSLGEVGSSLQTENEGLPPELNDTQQWRILDDHSLFNYKPVHYRLHPTEKPFCLCTLNSNIEKKKKCASCEAKCRRHQHVIWPVLFRERDITKRVLALQTGRVLERRSNQSKGDHYLRYHLTNQLNLSDEGKPDTFLAVLAVVSYCKRLLTDTPLGKACIHLVGQRIVDQLQRICIRDTRFTGVTGMAWGVASMLQDTCEETLLKDTSLWESSFLAEGLTPPKRIKNVMCPRLCSDRGRCINGACKCRRGYTSDDCSVPSRSPPQLIGVHNGGTCDIKAFHCKQVRLVGEGFHNSRELMCSFLEVKDATFETQTFLSKATYESFRGVTCEMPRSHDTDKAFTSYQVRVSNDGRLWSQPVPLFIFDGGCLKCTTRNMGCEIKSETCHIDGRCYKKGESSPRDPCKWCSPINSQQVWTDIACQHGKCNASSCAHGVCLDTTMGRYFCFCDEGFTGENCDIPEDPCIFNPCGTGICVQLGRTFRCQCPPGYAGVQCSVPVNPCYSNPCNNGSCITNGTHFSCFCDEGFTGPYCATSIQSCLCSHGKCVTRSGNHVCMCEEGFTGKLCEVPQLGGCALMSCKNGSCVDKEGQTKCVCNSGYTGSLCDIKIGSCFDPPSVHDDHNSTSCLNNSCGKRCHISDPCVPNLCVNGNCSRKSDGYHCLCHQGYKGRFCNETADHCLSNPCNHGQCVDDQGTYLCKCPPGFSGDTCNATVDVCQPNPCLNGNCIIVKGSFKCDCHYGFGGTLCDEKIVFDPCDKNPCDNGKCVGVQALKRSVPSFYCLCREGFTGQYCQSVIDPCTTNPCRHGLCKTANESGFRCTCFDGYQGVLCDTKINHCLTGPCVNGSCISSNASFECLCHQGYKGKLCDQAVEMCRPNPCKNGSCHQNGTSFKCSCFEGYTGNVCQTKITNCSLNPCKHGICVDKGKTFQCYCKRSYSGKFCHQKVNPCKPNPCKHGTCLHRYSSWFSCRCELGYTGKKCDKKINMCQSQPCKHGACINLGMSFRCSCYPGYRGRLCDKIETCQSRPCKRGNCFPTGNSFTCACPEKYTGRYCENKIDPCQLSPCKHGRCSLANQSVKCTCNKGYTGELCQVKMNPCSDNHCKHGKCIAHGVQYSCQCLLGFRGKYCETDINECLEAPCFAGVQCTNYPGNYSCGSCPAGFNGDGLRCEKMTHPCKKLNCFRDVPCVQRGQSYECGNCPRGFTGNGVLCTEINACSSNPCHRLAQCIQEKGSPKGFRCGPCPTGYKGNGITCTSLCPVPCPYGMECIGHFGCRCPRGYQGVGCQTPFCRAGCYNGGTCIMPNLCVCAEGFEGPACLSPVCRPPCRNDGNCIGPGKCRCPHGFTGPRCEKKSCLVTCLNGGRCRGPYVCQCMPGYSGQRCEIAPCTPSCQNGGLCVARDVCKCPAEYMGEQCQYPLCRPPCINGGDCVRPNVCMCPAAWKGNRCQMPVCHLPCLNGGKCARPNHCTCPSGYAGVQCEKAICNQPCLNEGQCVRPGVCACIFGFTGRQCEETDPWYNKRKHES